ncbi:unnamed protein product [Mytilus edulis]|uniref:Uncharacterized protein n=1 Tax=Mytilus edulis TaxID=6550 RepID=A0A8S3VPH8_MYTED|nr:unnamed protein product [Mytilus edulis]
MRKQSSDTYYSQKERENGEKARSVPVLETAVKRDILEIDKSLFFPKETGILCSIQYLAKRIMEKDEHQFGMGEKVHETISDLLFDRTWNQRWRRDDSEGPKSIPEEETEKAHPYISENLAQPEDQGAASPMPKAKETEKRGAGVEFGSRTQSKYKLSLYLMFPMYHQT